VESSQGPATLPGEIWLFIVGRVLAALGLGILLTTYLPQVGILGWPALLVGLTLLLVAAKGLLKKREPAPDQEPR
jgi:hypothetical protein